jgi:hypothetical protein
MSISVIECADCNMRFGITGQFEAARRKDHARFFCPRGHANIYRGESDEERLRKQLETQKQQNAMWAATANEQRQRAEAAERVAAAQKGVATKLKKRIAGGACPCCNRSFPNLTAHMKTKHPGFAETEA